MDQSIMRWLAVEFNSLSKSAINAREYISTSTPETSQIQNNGKILIAYFTMPETDGTDMSSSASRVINNDELMGATEYVVSGTMITICIACQME